MSSLQLAYAPLPGSNGMIEHALVPWDSDSFGFPVYELRIMDATLDADAIGVALASLDSGEGSLVVVKVDQQEVPLLYALARNGFYAVETMLELEGQLAYPASLPRESRIPVALRSATSEDMAEIERIAAAAFWSDRFHLDPNLSASAADERYRRWVERAFATHEMLFAFERLDTGDTIGFYHLREVGPGVIDLTLAALDPAMAGKGLGSVLYYTAMATAFGLGYRTAQTRVVARNLPVMNIFARAGFSFRAALTSLHRYLPPVSDSVAGAD